MEARSVYSLATAAVKKVVLLASKVTRHHKHGEVFDMDVLESPTHWAVSGLGGGVGPLRFGGAGGSSLPGKREDRHQWVWESW